MEESTSKEKILKEVRNALINKLENPFANIDFNRPVYGMLKEDPTIQFAINLNEAGGTFIYCENEKDIVENLKLLKKQNNWDSIYCIDERLTKFLTSEDFNVADDPDHFLEQQVGITRCEYLISRFGSIMVSSAIMSGRRMFVFPEVHIVVAAAAQVVPELKDALEEMTKNYEGRFPSQVTVITGPSRTADIEKTLVMGAHGPKELYVFMVDNA